MEPPITSGSANSSPTTGSSTEPTAVRSPNPSVLIVDDVELTRTLLRQYLTQTIFEADEAANGAIAVVMAKHRKYDFILMDLLMPEMDGFEAMRNIRMWEESRGLEPACVIITVTAWELKEAVPECFESGADMHLTKPITREKLLQVLSAQWSRVANKRSA